jgi:hypothetical protein
MTESCIIGTGELWKNFATSAATIIVGILGFTMAILTLIYSNNNNKRNHSFILEKDKRDREDRLKKDELDFAKDKRERQKAYNRVLGSFLKVYHSYIQHKFLFSELGVPNIPDKNLMQFISKLDNLNSEISLFKKVVSEESAIIPELTIYLHEILNLLGRFEMVEIELPADNSIEDLQKTKLLVQRAHSYAVQELLDEYFTDLIDKMAIKAEISDEFLKEIKEFNSIETVERNTEMQGKIMNRYIESISRQTGQNIDLNNIFPEE